MWWEWGGEPETILFQKKLLVWSTEFDSTFLHCVLFYFIHKNKNVLHDDTLVSLEIDLRMRVILVPIRLPQIELHSTRFYCYELQFVNYRA